MKSEKVYVTDIMGLCIIFNEYKQFSHSIQILNNGSLDDIENLLSLLRGENISVSFEVENFYHNNSEAIKKLESRLSKDDLIHFILLLYSTFKIIDNFYNYILKHKIDINKLYKLLERIKNLGFEEFDFCENADFSHEINNISEDLKRNLIINYLENIQVIPSYPGNIAYYSEGSSYLITLSPTDISSFRPSIKLNNLEFDPNCLPDKLDVKEFFSKLLMENQRYNGGINAIKYCKDFDNPISNLQLTINKLNELKNRVDSEETKDRLTTLLNSLEEEFNRLLGIKNGYIDISLNRYDYLTIEDLNGQTRKLTK